jgi:hypothetical protein
MAAPLLLISIGRRRARLADVEPINRLVAQCAEELVFSSLRSGRIAELVKKHAAYRVAADYVEFPAVGEDAVYQGNIIRVRKLGTPSNPSFKPTRE